MKLLIVEDDLLLQEGLALALGNEGYALDCAATAAEADALIQSGEYSLVILIWDCRIKTARRCSASGVVAEWRIPY